MLLTTSATSPWSSVVMMSRPNFESTPYLAQYAALVQPRVSEPVVAVGMLSRVNALRDAALGRSASHPSTNQTRFGRSPASGALPSTVLIALTRSHLYCFAYGLRGREMKVHDQVARFDRAGMAAEFSTTNLADRIVLTMADGRTLQFESMRGYDFNDELFRHLLGVYDEG